MNRHNNQHELYGCTLKLSRANEHLEALDQAIQSFWRRDPHGVRTQLDLETREYVVWTRIREDPPLEWSLLIGDILHNLRSALDHLAYQLVIDNDRTPSDRTSFPVFHNDPFTKNARGNRSWRERVEGMSDDDVALIKDLQPYQKRYHSGPETVEGDTLLALNNLWNVDKHRQLILAFTFHTGIHFGIEGLKGYEFVQVYERPNGPCKDGTIIARYKLLQVAPDPEVDVNVEVSFEIAIMEEGLPSAMEVLWLLRKMSRHVSDIVDIFAERFDQCAPDSSTAKG